MEGQERAAVSSRTWRKPRSGRRSAAFEGEPDVVRAPAWAARPSLLTSDGDLAASFRSPPLPSRFCGKTAPGTLGGGSAADGQQRMAKDSR